MTPEEKKEIVERLNALWEPAGIAIVWNKRLVKVSELGAGTYPNDCIVAWVLEDTVFPGDMIGATGEGETMNKLAGGSDFFEGPKQGMGNAWNTKNVTLAWAHEMGRTFKLPANDVKDNLMCKTSDCFGTKLSDEQRTQANAAAKALPKTFREDK
jgi:hypothetical protein